MICHVGNPKLPLSKLRKSQKATGSSTLDGPANHDPLSRQVFQADGP